MKFHACVILRTLARSPSYEVKLAQATFSSPEGFDRKRHMIIMTGSTEID